MPTEENKVDPNQLATRANRLFQAGKLQQALAAFRYLADNFPPKAFVLRRLGNILLRQGQHLPATQVLAKSIELEPGHCETWVDLGYSLRELGRAEEALAKFEHATRLDPRNALAWRYLGVAQMEVGHHDEALASMQRAILVDPQFVPSRVDMGVLYSDLGRLDEAIARLDDALAIDPDAALARSMKGEVFMLQGRYEEGWKAYEARFNTSFRSDLTHRAQVDKKPRWTGSEPLAGKTIVVQPEVGFGDFIMFSRYIPLLEERGARVVAYCSRDLAALMASSFPSATAVELGSELPPFDLQCPIMSLPASFGTTLDSIPSSMPYLRVVQGKKDEWAQRLGPRRARRIGLVWANQPRPIDRSTLRRRGMSIADIEPLLALPFEFHVLQKDLARDDLATLRGRPRVHAHTSDIANFVDTAALIEQMDAVVTIDTSVAHLAGALAKPTFVILPPACDYRWTRDAAVSPWYPTSSLHRRRIGGTWREPVETIRDLLGS